MKKLLSLALALCMALLLLPGAALAVETSGTCGDGVTWSLSDGTLTISGTGAMKNYSKPYIWSTNAPWDGQRSTITAIVIGDGVTGIGDYAFYYFDNLTSVAISNSVTAIGKEVFAECASLTSVTIPGSVTSIGESAFYHCENLASVTIPDGVTTIEKGVFCVCSNLTSVTIPDSVTSIGRQAFWNCTNLTSVTIPDSVTAIGDEAFSWCESLTNVTIPSRVTSIGKYTFISCESLTSVTIPASVITIGKEAFWLCKSLKDVYYGGSESQWKQIAIAENNGPLTAAAFHYNSAVGSTPSTPSTPAETTPSAPDTPSTPATTTTGFPDVAANSAFAPAISWAVENGITTGKTDGTFAPNENCTNGQILTFLWRANGSPEPTIDNPFTDSIPASFQKAAVWASEKGLVSGGVFGSDTPCTRSMVVTYLWQLAGSPAVSGSASFPDVASGAEYAQAVTWAVENGITTGKTDGTFAPGEVCTRGQIVTFLYRDFA